MTRQDKLEKGVLTLKRGFGFIALERSDGESLPDLFVPPENVGPAVHEATVLVRRIQSRGREAAVIEKVVERAATEIIGTVDRRGREPLVLCERATEPLRIDFTQDSPGRNALVQGHRVVARITKYTTDNLPGRCVIAEVLGPAGDPEVELKASRLAHFLPKRFQAEVLAAARSLPATLSADEVRKRRDLRKLGVFTIDPTDARDFDDAISLERLPDGWLRVGIHIADVSHYVREGDAIDKEAYDRATSVYLPGEVIPMLPERLSNGLCSLVENEDRPTVTVFAEFDPQLKPRRFSHCRSLIRSQRRFTYEEVDKILEGAAGDFRADILTLKRVSESLNRIRLERGAVDLDLPEEKPILDVNGKVIAVKRIERTWSHRLIEELMILANEYVARAIARRGIFRVHEPPSPARLLQLRRFLATLGRSLRCDDLQQVLDHFRGTPSQVVVETMVLRSMQEARYSHENLGHYGLASDAYTHFTSPIRRYPDLIVHRLLMGEKVSRPLAESARHSSLREREAMEAERDALEIKLLEFAESRLGDEVKGVVDGVTRDGVWLALDFGPRGFLPVQGLNDRFHFDRDAGTLSGRRTGRQFKIGMTFDVQLASVDIAQRALLLALAEKRREVRPRTPQEKPRRRDKGPQKARREARREQRRNERRQRRKKRR